MQTEFEKHLQAQSKRAHEIQDVITMFFLRLTSKMDCSAQEIAEALVACTSYYIAIAAKTHERAEVADAMCAEIKRRVSRDGRRQV